MRRTCLDMVHDLARKDERVLYIGSDPGPGTLDPMKSEFPDRFFIEGVAEANVVGMSAGLAMEGFVPYVNTIATFLTRRCFEQVAIDLCLHNVKVRLIGNGGGYVYAPLGPTHQAIEDLAIMRALPNMTVVCVSDAQEMTRLMEESLEWPGPIYIRLGKGGDPVISSPDENFRIGKAILKKAGGEVLMVSTGVTTKACLDAAETLENEGVSCGVLHMHTIKPLDLEALEKYTSDISLLVSVEEHTRAGGLGSAMMEALTDRPGSRLPPMLRLGIPDDFTHHYGSQADHFERCGIDAEGIVGSIRNTLGKESLQ